VVEWSEGAKGTGNALGQKREGSKKGGEKMRAPREIDLTIKIRGFGMKKSYQFKGAG